jgi:hypothetical protein
LVECKVLEIRLVGDLTRRFYWGRGDVDASHSSIAQEE